jgi:hypothetical protein
MKDTRAGEHLARPISSRHHRVRVRSVVVLRGEDEGEGGGQMTGCKATEDGSCSRVGNDNDETIEAKGSDATSAAKCW